MKLLKTTFFLLVIALTSTFLVTQHKNAAGMGGIQFQETTTSAGLSYVGMTFGASWGDFDGDGWPDLWVSNHFDPPSLYLNQEDGTFVDIAPTVWSANPYADTHGAAWGDFDNDGDQDLVEMVGADMGTGTGQDHFFVNNKGLFVEQAAVWGLDDPYGRGRTPLWLDWSQDGQLDLLLTNLARTDDQSPSTLYQQGAGVFQEAAVGFDSPDHAKFAQLADLSGDGWLDLIVHGWPYPQKVYDFSSTPFTNLTTAIGLPSSAVVGDIILADFNNDLRTDLYVLRYDEDDSDYALIDNDTMHASFLIEGDEKGVSFQTTGEVTFNLFEWNLEAEHIFIGLEGAHPTSCCTFTLSPEDPTVAGIYPHTPGVDNGVYIGYEPASGTWQLLVSSSAGYLVLNALVDTAASISSTTPVGFDPVDRFLYPRLLLYNPKSDRFEDETVAAGLAVLNQCLSGAAGDFDNDMDVDFYLVCSRPVMNLPNVLYENRNDGTFVPVPSAGGAAGSAVGNGDTVAAADYDRDGFLDLFVTNGAITAPFPHGPHQLFRNLGNDNHWIEIDLVGRVSNRDGIGARVLVTAGGIAQLREQGGGMHNYAQDHQRLHFGLGSQTEVEQLVIQWPSGIVQVLENVAADQILQIVEPLLVYLPVVQK